MSKKRTAAELNNDDQTTEGSDRTPVTQQQGDAKRAKLVLLSDTTLEDLPIELLKCILVKVVVMEVMDMRLARRGWKGKADLVINRLCAVYSQWSSICATKYFRNEVHRTLNDTAQKTIRFEILHRYPIQFVVSRMTVLKDEVFILCKPNGKDYIINVLDCNNMADVKDVIQLPGIRPRTMAGCSVSNCVYVHHAEEDESIPDSILRIANEIEEHQFTLSPWIATDEKLSLPTSFTVSANGNLITRSRMPAPNPAVLSIYAANGSLQHKVVLHPDIYGYTCVTKVIQKSNGNLVLVSQSFANTAQLMEIDTFGIVVRRYRSSLGPQFSVNFVDLIYDRILITSGQAKFVLLDSEFHSLDVSGVQLNDSWAFLPRKLHFNSERNEIMCICNCLNPGARDFSSFRFVSE